MLIPNQPEGLRACVNFLRGPDAKRIDTLISTDEAFEVLVDEGFTVMRAFDEAGLVVGSANLLIVPCLTDPGVLRYVVADWRKDTLQVFDPQSLKRRTKFYGNPNGRTRLVHDLQYFLIEWAIL